ncbi:MAG: hypothetical protein ACREBU_18355 [Nitrososphaera sp.]
MAEDYKKERLEGARQSLKDLKENVQSGGLEGLELGVAKAYINHANELLGKVHGMNRMELQQKRDECLSYGIDIDAL